MSLVGSEVDISISTDGSRGLSKPPNVVSDDELSIPDETAQESSSGGAGDFDYHPPLTPPRPAEQLFMSNLETQNISAAALAQQIHQSFRSPSFRTGTSVATDDFVTAAGSLQTDDFDDALFSDDTPPPAQVSSRSSDTLTLPFAADDDSDIDSNNFNPFRNPFRKDALSRNYELNHPEEEIFKDSNNKMATTTYASVPPNGGGKKFFPTEAPTHVDAAEKVYDAAKGAWAWGKGVPVLSPVLGLYEGVAGKAAEIVAGKSLEGVDGEVVRQLHGLDDGVLNPAIEKIAKILLGVAGKSEDILKPIIIAILKPLGLIKDTAENPEQTPVPGVTTKLN